MSDRIVDALTLATLHPDTPMRLGDVDYHRHAHCLLHILMMRSVLGGPNRARERFDQHGAQVGDPKVGERCTWCGEIFREMRSD